MLLLLRRGYAFDVAVFLAAAIVLGAAVAHVVATAIDAAFGDAVGHLLGDAGEYDVIVHLREEAAEGSLPVLREMVLSRFPRARIKTGVTVAGNANVFIGLPPEDHRQDVFESLPALFSEVTGYNGFTWVVEPSLSISSVRPGVADELMPRLAGIEGVRFPFRYGSRITLVLDDATKANAVADAVERLLDGYRVIEVRMPDGVTEAQAAAFWESLEEEEKGAWIDVSAAEGSDSPLDNVIRNVSQILDLYASRVYASPDAGLQVGDRILMQGAAPHPPQVGTVVADPGAAGFVVAEITSTDGGRPIGRIVVGDASDLVSVGPGRFAEIAYRLEGDRVAGAVGTVTVESLRYALDAAVRETAAIIERVERLAVQLEDVGGQAVDTLSRWLTGLLQLDEAQRQMAEAERQVNTGETSTTNAIVSVLLSLLARNGDLRIGDTDLGALIAQGRGVASASPGQREGFGGDLEALRTELEALQRQVDELGAGAAADLTEAAARVRDHLPQLRDDALAETLRWLDGTGAAGLAWGDGWEILVPANVSPEYVRDRVEQATSVRPLVAAYEAGILNPNPRTTILQLLTQVRQTVAGLIAFGLTAFLLWADGATLLRAADLLRRVPGAVPFRPGTRRRARPGTWSVGTMASGALLGAALLSGIYALAGSGIPGIGPGAAAASGAAMGLVTALLAARISPVDPDEVIAGVACGLAPDDVMREIVVPEGRPGLLLVLNRWRMRMR